MTATEARPRQALDPADLDRIDRYWRAANYLSVGQIFLVDNPLLREPLRPEHIKPRLLGHWGTVPGLNFLYAHLSHQANKRGTEMMWIVGPGHGGPATVATAWLDGTYTDIYPDVTQDAEGMRKLFRQFSFPGGVPSHNAPEVPGSIHEGGELGYSLAHAHGAAFDNPGLVVATVIGDGEAETGPLAASWQSHRFSNPARDGAVLPILHLNGYKIANPSLLARIPEQELLSLLEGNGYRPHVVSADDPETAHARMADALGSALDEIADIQHNARESGRVSGARWPMLVLRSPKGWTGPHEVGGLPVEGTWRSHQIPLAAVRDDPEQMRALESWMHSYRPGELFDSSGAPLPEVCAPLPAPERRLSASPHANGGLLLKDLRLPDIRQYAVQVPEPGTEHHQATRVLGGYIRDVIRANPRTFRMMGPDETTSNKLDTAFEAGGRAWAAERLPTDEYLDPDGRVMEVLSEHLCQGWLEGYLLTGRHGLFNSYEAFVHIVDSMFNQHAKWLKVTRDLPWRRPISSLNYLLSSHVWQQDHNGFTHQDPGFLNHVLNKVPEIIRMYLPPDTNSALVTTDQCLRMRDTINVVVAGKHPALSFLSMDRAQAHLARGAGIWEWASTDDGAEPDVVLACAGDAPTRETLAAAALVREHLPELRVRVVNVVDLMRLTAAHPHGMSDRQFDALFTAHKPVIFAFHGYPSLIHRLTYRRNGHENLHVRGYKEEGTTTTPFDMLMLNDLDRFHLVMDVIDHLPGLGVRAAHLRQRMQDERMRCRAHTRVYGEDPPDIRDWTWG
ncbi:xylulose-5-phosphate/fructose-6-phosphate phosphoketolase [Lipingzhangella halophila]|uniref:Probable phosphoketolase n=1 Tax=Lipingzhangella halophila TaxID=1783352 RepID=A0A7W7RF09_9ACTN|nr:phosphoketolase family protein [Lipingzhangella halophila]MBB4930221.1 xylulose-5-phosphate/fructose-6-phosphate phosphoketolase [Lipingzhangella halophila]